jgi:uncharacterized phage protein (TIGR01671 family)
MREIKFRAWDEVHKKMCFPERLFCKKDGIVWHVDLGYSSRIIGEKGFKLMQYTGLKDKNGVEIYEGDIVVVHEGEDWKWTHPVEFFHGGFWVTDENCLGAINEFCEVIGNIYENPELLEETK